MQICSIVDVKQQILLRYFSPTDDRTAKCSHFPSVMIFQCQLCLSESIGLESDFIPLLFSFAEGMKPVVTNAISLPSRLSAVPLSVVIGTNALVLMALFLHYRPNQSLMMLLPDLLLRTAKRGLSPRSLTDEPRLFHPLLEEHPRTLNRWHPPFPCTEDRNPKGS